MKVMNREKLNHISGLKIIALLMIFWWHSPLTSPSFDMGARACEFLFVSSGFLVAYNYNEKKMPATWQQSVYYSIYKLAKAYPLYLIAFLGAFVLDVYGDGLSLASIWRAILQLCCVQAWSSDLGSAMSFNGPSWFFSALLFCYFMTPFQMKVINHLKNPRLGFLMVAFLRVGVEYISRNFQDSVFFLQVHVNPFVRCLEFFLGMFVAYFLTYGTDGTGKKPVESQWKANALEIGSVVALVSVSLVCKDTLYRGVYVILFAGMLYAFGRGYGVVSRFLANPLFQRLARYQLEIYLLHSCALKYTDTLLPKLLPFGRDRILITLVAFVITIALSVLYKKYFERPLQNYVRRMFNTASFALFGKSVL